VIGPSQRPLPDKTQHSRQTDIHDVNIYHLMCQLQLPSSETELDPMTHFFEILINPWVTAGKYFWSTTGYYLPRKGSL